MTSSAEALPAPRPQLRDRDARPGLARLTRVELRKMTDTRSGFWLLLAVAGLMLLTVVISLLSGHAADHRFRTILSNALQPALVLLPVVGILLVTAEWSQRTGLVTFALVPARLRVILAKALAGTLLALVAVVVAVVLAAIGVAIASPPTDHVWTLPAGLLGQDALYLVLAMLTGIGFGAALLSPAPAIVLSFALPIAVAALGSISWLEGPAEWLDTSKALSPLSEEVLSGRQWGQVLTASLLWTAVPLAIGIWRIRRNEVR
ncbi:MAG: ABC transporter permease [Actinobacteria bacterium]|nr:ABC transporter permease [Actinomycetota bacterium]